MVGFLLWGDLQAVQVAYIEPVFWPWFASGVPKEVLMTVAEAYGEGLNPETAKK